MNGMNEQQFALFLRQLAHTAQHSPFYQKVFREAGLESGDVKTRADFQKIPFTDKVELRKAYPLGLQAVPDEQVVRIHSSSGTTGEAVIIPYTAQDVADWATMFARCYEIAGVTNRDRVQITPGYGLWTAGIGFQAGCEKIGAMAVPTGPGNTEKQLRLMVDLQTTVLGSTSSYALLLAERVEERNLLPQLALRKGIIGSERWGDKMRNRIAQSLHIELYDIYGLTEVYGPGIAIDCDQHNGMHYFDDFLYFEIIDPKTGQNLPDGEYGELVITTLRKEAAPVIRYRTHDMTRLLPGECPCGRSYPRHDRILGRTDDMVKVKGVNIYPGQVDNLLQDIPGVSSEYQIIIDNPDGRDHVLLKFEHTPEGQPQALEEQVALHFKQRAGIKIKTQAVPIGGLPRSEKKTVRIFDQRCQ